MAGEVLVQFRRSASDAAVQARWAADAEGRRDTNNLHVAEVPGETIGYIEMLESQPDVLLLANYI